MKITGDYDDKKLIHEHFRKPVKDYFWTPLYKSGRWDGHIKFFNLTTGLLPYGLYISLFSFLKTTQIQFRIDPQLKIKLTPSKEDLSGIITQGIPEQFSHREYQLDAALKILSFKRGILEHATASGKTFTLFLIFNYLLKKNYTKFIFIVPTISLISQGVADLKSYGIDENLIGKYYGEEKDDSKLITIGTWQSLRNANKLLEDAEVIVADECFVKDTKITTLKGQKNIQDIKIGQLVLTFNEITKEYEYNPVLKLYKNAALSSYLIEIELENNTIIKVTPNHKFLTKNRGWVEATELTELDEFFDEIHQ